MTGKKRRAEETAEFEGFAYGRGQSLFRTALLLCGDWHLAEDLTQVTLAKLYASWSKVRRAENQDAYARSTLVRTYLSHRRLRRTGERPALGELPEGIAPEGDPALRVTLLTALAELPPRDRAVLVLRYWEDRSVDETAAELGLSTGAVRSQSLRALGRLRAVLGPEAADQLTLS
ncbi:RNA polymerase sigma-70 factor (sigma-E family) [Streptomyces sp. 1114.5]|uniref:SigE family RNA polymerase sigma factor n=1 Tax=unclassified Streptomyces TaxID=2593676 RepID=UPI000BCD792E|nr:MULTISPECIES: SigE family RNA polymerase sigma factor [unclassified Streptomyces]RKT17928.1 RNA polymerase sigma-70 factor (sigma-E family) [Streptomyces sp. 1114.5]SOB84135.1 RNA polymerase sigma-70 factor, sigma-E family [Streptomyces sp. 1331.2]